MSDGCGEVKSLRFLANMFPYTEHAETQEDKICNCINVYCTRGADKIEELLKIIEEQSQLLETMAKINENKK